MTQKQLEKFAKILSEKLAPKNWEEAVGDIAHDECRISCEELRSLILAASESVAERVKEAIANNAVQRLLDSYAAFNTFYFS